MDAKRFKSLPEIIIKPHLTKTENGYRIILVSEDIEFSIEAAKNEVGGFDFELKDKSAVEMFLSSALKKEIES